MVDADDERELWPAVQSAARAGRNLQIGWLKMATFCRDYYLCIIKAGAIFSIFSDRVLNHAGILHDLVI